MAQWLDILREKNQLAEQLGEKIPRFLAYDGLTLDQAKRLHVFLQKHAEDMRKLTVEIGAADLVEALAAAALNRTFSDLAASAALKVDELKKTQRYSSRAETGS